MLALQKAKDGYISAEEQKVGILSADQFALYST